MEFFDRLDVGDGVSLFDRMIVLEATIVDYGQRILYTAIHPDFDELREGQIIPLYEGVIFDGRGAPVWRINPVYFPAMARPAGRFW